MSRVRGPVVGLTARQSDVLAVIISGIREHGHSPTAREIAAAIGVGSEITIHDHLRELERKGHIVRPKQRLRGIVLTTKSGPTPGTLLVRTVCPGCDAVTFGCACSCRFAEPSPEFAPVKKAVGL